MRRPDWPERLTACVEAARSQPFAWGSHDCALWTCDVIAELTGVDPARAFRGKYNTPLGALRYITELGCKTLWDVAAAFAEYEGFASIPPALAQRGDLVLCPSGHSTWPHALGICLGRYAVMTGKAGLVLLPMNQALSAWRVD